MAFELRNDVRRNCNPATSGSCLRRPRQQMPVYVHDLFMHVDPPVQQVKIRSPQRPKLTETEPAPVSKQDHRVPSRVTAPARASTSPMLATGRSLGRSVPAPFTLQGLADSTPSATAVLRLTRSTWYAFGAMAGRFASRDAPRTGQSKR